MFIRCILRGLAMHGLAQAGLDPNCLVEGPKKTDKPGDKADQRSASSAKEVIAPQNSSQRKK